MLALRCRLGTMLVPLLLAVAVTASASGVTLYRIHAGDTLSAIAARYHTTVARLVALNHLPGNGSLIIAGATLRLPARHAAPRRAHTRRATATWRTVTTRYVVRRGDSLDAVAARFHADPRQVAIRNHLPRSLIVMIGQRLVIAHRVRVVHRVTAPTQRGPYQFRGGRVPTPHQVGLIVRATAKRWGVEPRLAQAVAWQESGFNQRWVSSTGAVGAMQVEPYTGAFVAKYLVHRRLNLYDARDNATAGVALLSVLLRETHGNARKAVAGYYQGLASVLSRGMFTDTKRYVANVLALRNRFPR